MNLSAAVQLGSLIEYHWKYKDAEQADKISVPGFKWIIISPADKESVRANLITKMYECLELKLINKQLVRSIITLCRFDYPDSWPNLMTDITNALSSGNQRGILTGLQALFCLTKKFEFELEEDREPLFDIMKHSLGIIGPIIDSCMNQGNDEMALKSLHLIGKIFYNAN